MDWLARVMEIGFEQTQRVALDLLVYQVFER